MPHPALNSRFFFVTGKGGVGKTILSAAMAIELSEQGHKTLLVSTDPAHSVSDCFCLCRAAGERKISTNLFSVEIEPEKCAFSYIQDVGERMRLMVRPELYPRIDEQMKLALMSPGVNEAALILKISYYTIQSTYAKVVFDMAPSGHSLQILKMPEIMSAWTAGLLRNQKKARRLRRTAWMMDNPFGLDGTKGNSNAISYNSKTEENINTEKIKNRPNPSSREYLLQVLNERQNKLQNLQHKLCSPEETSLFLILTPENLPILEAKRTHKQLKALGVRTSAVLVNRILPQENSNNFWRNRKEIEAEYLQEIRQDFSGLPLYAFPLMSRDVRGMKMLKEVWKSGWQLESK